MQTVWDWVIFILVFGTLIGFFLCVAFAYWWVFVRRGSDNMVNISDKEIYEYRKEQDAKNQ
jgi:hypothetical protein